MTSEAERARRSMGTPKWPLNREAFFGPDPYPVTNPKAGQPDMVEVVAWLSVLPNGEHLTKGETENGQPLVRLSDYAALQSQLEAAERERGEILSDFATTAFALEAAEAERDAMREALEPFARGWLDVSHTAIILDADARGALEAARKALQPQEASQ